MNTYRNKSNVSDGLSFIPLSAVRYLGVQYSRTTVY